MTFALCAAGRWSGKPMRARSVGRLAAFLFLLAVGATYGCRHRRSETQRQPDVAGDQSATPPSAAAVTAEPRDGRAGLGRATEDVSSKFAIVEWAEADVIRVNELNAISIEANDIRCPRIKRTPRSYPVPKDAGWRRIEGHEVELETLWAHHVSARLIVADRIVATKILKVAKPYVWPGEGARPVRNRIVKVDPGTGRAVTE